MTQFCGYAGTHNSAAYKYCPRVKFYRVRPGNSQHARIASSLCVSSVIVSSRRSPISVLYRARTELTRLYTDCTDLLATSVLVGWPVDSRLTYTYQWRRQKCKLWGLASLPFSFPFSFVSSGPFPSFPAFVSPPKPSPSLPFSLFPLFFEVGLPKSSQKI